MFDFWVLVFLGPDIPNDHRKSVGIRKKDVKAERAVVLFVLLTAQSRACQ